ncbi:MAG TPA: AAA family ATPase [Cyclobacteriaceae bacterium]|nr:AAA family ATPase [Cyclobacteriaceae bacterium]
MPIKAWWRQTEEDNKALPLLQKYEVSEGVPREEAYLYVFTPQGDIRRLKQGSNVLDFAYRLHTEMGHHCRSAKINGQFARHDAELFIGDLIQLEYDPMFSGPDPAWLHIANDPYTRAKIKRGLGARQRAVHEGRALLDRFLNALAQESGFIVPEPKLEKYFEMIVENKGLPDKTSLFEAVISQGPHTSIPAEQVVAYILESELAGAVLDGDGKPLLQDGESRPTLTRPVLRFCPNCKPAPGNPIFLHRKTVGKAKERLTVHRMPHPDRRTKRRFFGLPTESVCLLNISPDEIDDTVHWEKVPRERLAVNLTVLGKDRSHLVGDVLIPIYDDDSITLSHIKASADADGLADIWLTVECDTQQQIKNLQHTLEQVKDITKVSVWPVSLPQVAHLKARYGGRASNPFTALPVADPQMLVGREQEILQLRDWLERAKPESLILVHGERRAGKSSLVRLAPTYLRGPIRTVYGDLLWVSKNATRAQIYQYIAEEIGRDLADTISASDLEEAGITVSSTASPQEWEENPGKVLRAYLHDVQRLIHPQRILLILDEFNVVLENPQDSALFSDLRALTLDGFSWLTLLLVAYTSQVRKFPVSHPAWELYQQCQKLEVSVLNPHSARELIEKPTRNYLEYQPGVVNQLVLRTNGHPYLINLLCRLLVQRVSLRGQHYVSWEDLQVAEEDLLCNGKLSFNFLIEKIDSQLRPLVVSLAEYQKEDMEAVTLDAVADACSISIKDAQRRARFLHDHGILTLQDTNSGVTRVQFSIPYFCTWVNKYGDFT